MEKTFRFITAIALLTAMCLAACNKVELTEDPIDEPGTEVTPSQGWTVAISATIGGDASTKALTEDPSTHKLIATFETTDNIYVYNRTKDKQDATVLHPDRSGATAVISGTLTGEYDAADEIVLCYNMDEYHRFHYLGQKGTLATVADFAKAEKTITVAEATDKALSGSVSFDNLQSVFRFTFTDGSSTVPVRSVSISTAGDKLVQTDLRYKPDWNSMYYGAVDVEPDATTTDPITVALRNENASDDTFYFEVDNGSGVIYKGTKPAPAGKIVNGKFYESTVTLTQVPKPTVINTNDASAIEPNYGNYGYLDAGNLTVSGTGVGYYFSWAEQTFKSLTLSGANLTSLEQEPISSASSILNPIIIEGDNFIVTDASHAGIKYKSYRSGTTFTQTIRGNGTLTVTASNTIGVKGFLDSYNESNAVAAASGYVLTVSDGTDNGDGTSTWVYTVRPEATDLSASATANCYIVSAAGDYKFRATVKGNGAADLGGISKDTDASSIASAELIWSSFGTSTAPAADELIKDISYSDGYVFFSTADSFHEGNALIAIKNSSDEILWSWHIWVHNYDESYLTGANSVQMMNVSSPLSYGMYYQWGRKDPFVGSSSGTTLAAVYGTAKSVEIGSVSVETGIKNPCNYYVAVNTANRWTNGDNWCSDDAKMTLWSSSGKTIFDPCPPGWRMPSFSEITGMGSSYYTTGRGFPASGYFGTEGAYYNPNNGTIWAATVDGSCAKIQVMADDHMTYSRSPDMGFNVRCVRE